MRRGGIFIWDEINNCLLFVSREQKDKDKILHETFSPLTLTSLTSQKQQLRLSTIQSNDTEIYQIQNVSQAKYRKDFQRRVKLNEADIITIQDVKDVALFSTNPVNLTPEFIKFFHTSSMDKFLRSLIVYFQYYIRLWEKMSKRRIATKRKLKHPETIKLESCACDNLSELRCLVGRYYAVLLMGMHDSKNYHHMHNKNNTSLSDKDRRLFECLVPLLVRVVWIALKRKQFSLIQIELNRLLRTVFFSPEENKTKEVRTFNPNRQEKVILEGNVFRKECKLKHKSPAIQEMIFQQNFNYRLMAIGIFDLKTTNERLNYLEIAYEAPEEQLNGFNVNVGILGLSRQQFDAMLKPLENDSHKLQYNKTLQLGPLRNLNNLELIDLDLPCHFKKETQSTIEARAHQCKMWLKYLKNMCNSGFTSGGYIESMAQYQSFMSARTSVLTW